MRMSSPAPRFSARSGRCSSICISIRMHRHRRARTIGKARRLPRAAASNPSVLGIEAHRFLHIRDKQLRGHRSVLRRVVVRSRRPGPRSRRSGGLVLRPQPVEAARRNDRDEDGVDREDVGVLVDCRSSSGCGGRPPRTRTFHRAAIAGCVGDAHLQRDHRLMPRPGAARWRSRPASRRCRGGGASPALRSSRCALRPASSRDRRSRRSAPPAASTGGSGVSSSVRSICLISPRMRPIGPGAALTAVDDFGLCVRRCARRRRCSWPAGSAGAPA